MNTIQPKAASHRGARPTISDSYFPTEETELILELVNRTTERTTDSTTESSSKKGGQTSGQTSGQTGGQTIEQIYELIKSNPKITRTELSRVVGISPSAIQKHIDKLKGVRIRRAGGDFGGHWEIVSQ